MSAYHFVRKSGYSSENSNGTANLSGICFKRKMRGRYCITLSRFYQNDRNFLYHLFGVPVPGFMLREIEKIYRYFVTDTTQLHSHFGRKKITVQFCTCTFQQKIFIESFIKMVSS